MPTLSATERIEKIAEQCRAYQQWLPEAAIIVTCRYLAGEDVLDQVKQEWKQVNSNVLPYVAEKMVVLSDAPEQLDELDLRLLIACMAINTLGVFFQQIARQPRILQARDYLLQQGVSEERIALSLLDTRHDYLLNPTTPTALGALLLSSLPKHFPAVLGTLGPHTPGADFIPYYLVALLLADPTSEHIEMAWQVAQLVNYYYQGPCAALLLKADPARFTEWARQIAGPANAANHQARLAALQALLEYDLAGNVDLVVEAARTPPGSHWDQVQVQCLGLEAAYRFDPEKYLPLVEEAAVKQHPALGKKAVELLEKTYPPAARPVLQHCVASGHVEAALKALDVLLEYDWPERQAYMFSLLPHRSKQIRDSLLVWLVDEGQAIVEPLGTQLNHPNAVARLTVVQALGRIGGERALALLTARRESEKSQKVKQAIVDVVGVGADTPASAKAASPIARITAEAEATLKQITRPALLWFDPTQAPAMRWATGEPVPHSVIAFLLQRQARAKGVALDERVSQAFAQVNRASAGELAWALWSGWIGQGAKSEQSWLLPLICSLADERLVYPMRQYIESWSKTARGALAAKAVAAMTLMESDLALTEVSSIAERARHAQVKAAARKALTDTATRLNISQDELSDRIVPALGFNEQSERVFDYGPRQFTARLKLNQSMQITDNAGKTVSALPKPGARDDAEKAAAAFAAWKLLKTQLPQVVKLQTQRMEYALVSQRSWDVARWQALFPKHPLLRSFAITLIWGVVEPDGSGYHCLFRPMEDGSLTDYEDNSVALPAEGQVRMVHPVELDEATRSAWMQHLADYEITPAFLQLNRAVVRVSPEEREAVRWEKYQGYVLNGGALKGRFMKAGWERGSVQDGGAYHTIWKAWPTVGVQAILETAGLAVGFEQEFTTAILRLAFARTDTIKRGSYIYDDLKEQDSRALKLGEVPPVIFSEAAGDVAMFAAVGEYHQDWEKKVW
jgi:hypothetical protein